MNKVAKKIISDSKEQVKLIEERLEKELEELTARNESEVINLTRALEEKYQQELKAEERRIEARMHLVAKKDILAARHDEMRNLKSIFTEKIYNDSDIFRNFLKDSILKAARTGNEKIIPSEADRNLFSEKEIKSINESVSALKNIKSQIELSDESFNKSRGILLREGKYSCAITAESAADMIFENHDIKVAKILFKEG